MPNQVMVYGENRTGSIKSIIPFMEFYSPEDDGSRRVYLCQNFSYKLSTSDCEIVKEQLGGVLSNQPNQSTVLFVCENHF